MIINFPNNDPAAGLLAQLRNRMVELDTIYDKLEESRLLVYQNGNILLKLEQFASAAELEFDKCLTEYAGLIGGENLEVQLLHYSQNTKVVHDEQCVTWHLEWINNKDETDS